MFVRDTALFVSPGHRLKCPHCTSYLRIRQDPDHPAHDDVLHCHFHGDICTREEATAALQRGEIDTVRDPTVAIPRTSGPEVAGAINKFGYRPQPGDAALLARLMYAEAAGAQGYYDDIGWAIVNRVGATAEGFPTTLSGVVNQKNAFASVNGPLWQQVSNLSKMKPGELKSYNLALATAKKILAGQLSDPTHGIQFYYSGTKPPSKWFRDEIASGSLHKDSHLDHANDPFTFLDGR